MTAKIDLIAKLTAVMHECAGEIAKILHDYEIMPAKVYERSNLPRRVDVLCILVAISENDFTITAFLPYNIFNSSNASLNEFSTE